MLPDSNSYDLLRVSQVPTVSRSCLGTSKIHLGRLLEVHVKILLTDRSLLVCACKTYFHRMLFDDLEREGPSGKTA